MGPIVTEAAPQCITGYIDKGVTEGAERLVEGRDFDASGTGIGCAEFVMSTAKRETDNNNGSAAATAGPEQTVWHAGVRLSWLTRSLTI